MPLSPKAAAARLGLTVGRVRQLIASGALRAVNVGVDRPVWAIDEQELERFAALDRPSHRPRKETNVQYRLTDYQDTVAESLSALHDAARELATQARQADGQAWTTMHFQKMNGDNIQGEGSFNVEPNTPMRIVWHWQH